MRTRTRKKKPNAALIAVLCLCILVGTVGGTYAYLTATAAPASNEFIPAKVSCMVEEDFADGVKSNVKVQNTGNIDAYIRATVVATFVGDDGKVLATAPIEGVNYTVDWAADGWTKSTDGYWYHVKPVKPNDTTGCLINSAQAVSSPSGYRLNLQILATGIQSAPDSAVQDAWGVTVSNGELLP